jgi:quercetin dioxygenase-like cupin family protein
VRFHRTGTKRIHHPLVGELDLRCEAMEISADSGLTMSVYAAPSPTAPPNKPWTCSQAGRRRPSPRTEKEILVDITRSSIETAKGPDTWFTGDVYIDAVAAAPSPARVQANLVHFTPGARTAWHTHPLGQTIYVTEGVGLCQRRGGPIEVIRPGDRVFFAPDEDHWHGAAPNRFMVHLALNEVDDHHRAANWGDKVTDDEYGAARA